MTGLASTYQDPQQKKQDSGGESLGQSIGNKVGTTGGNTGSAGTGTAKTGALNKTAQQYANRVNQLAQDPALQWQQPDNVTQARNYLDEVIANKPGAYKSQYTGQVQSLYDRIMNREKFSYDQNSDAMYQMYSQAYRNAGLRNQRDVQGQAAAQSGGYGSSYGQTAGQSAYNASMGQMAQMLPQMQAQALDRYSTEMQNDANLYNTAMQAEQSDYGRYQDRMNMWQQERQWAAGEYDRQYGNAYNEWQQSQGAAQQLVGMERDDRQQAMQQAQSQAQMYIQAGIMPNKDLIAASGWDEAGVRELVRKYR